MSFPDRSAGLSLLQAAPLVCEPPTHTPTSAVLAAYGSLGSCESGKFQGFPETFELCVFYDCGASLQGRMFHLRLKRTAASSPLSHPASELAFLQDRRF